MSRRAVPAPTKKEREEAAKRARDQKAIACIQNSSRKNPYRGTVGALLGEGTYGTVYASCYKGRDGKQGCTRVLKIVLGVRGNPDVLEDALYEGKLGRTLTKTDAEFRRTPVAVPVYNLWTCTIAASRVSAVVIEQARASHSLAAQTAIQMARWVRGTKLEPLFDLPVGVLENPPVQPWALKVPPSTTEAAVIQLAQPYRIASPLPAATGSIGLATVAQLAGIARTEREFYGRYRLIHGDAHLGNILVPKVQDMPTGPYWMADLASSAALDGPLQNNKKEPSELYTLYMGCAGQIEFGDQSNPNNPYALNEAARRDFNLWQTQTILGAFDLLFVVRDLHDAPETGKFAIFQNFGDVDPKYAVGPDMTAAAKHRCSGQNDNRFPVSLEKWEEFAAIRKASVLASAQRMIGIKPVGNVAQLRTSSR